MDKSRKQLQEDKKVMKSKLTFSNHNFQNGGRTSTSEDENNASWREPNKNHYRAKSKSYEDAENEEADEDVIEIDSEDSQDAMRNINNNNEEALPDRHRAYEDEQNHDSDRESTSSDIVVVRDDYQSFYEEIEELSRINTRVQLHPDDKVSIKNFKIHKLLGTGAYGKVYSVEKLDGVDKGQIYAMKVLEKHKVTQKKKTTEHTRTEREVLEKVIDCPFLATLYYAFQTSEKLYLIMEFVQGGELFSHLYKLEHFEETQVRFYIAEIVVALEQLHEQNIIYRDIKLENILLDKDGHIIITDFGLSKELKDGARTKSYCGTIEYMAPEIVNPRGDGHDLNVDWWSVGVLIIELLSGQSPFSRENEESNQAVISERIQNCAPIIPDNVGPEARDLILRLLEKDPRKRLGYKNDAADIKKHKFFRNIDWDILKQKNYEAPMVPEVKDKFDVSQFSAEFTNQNAFDGPSENGPPQGPNAQKYFRGYSFVAPIFRKKTTNNFQIVDKPEMNRPSIEDVFKVQSKRKSPFFDKYRIYEESSLIGDGTYSLCMECVSLKHKEKFAVKILKLNHDTSQEIAALKKCQGHPNVVKLVETMKDDYFTYIVCELLSGDELFSRIRKCNYLNESMARRYFLQILNAVIYMHSKSIVHRDLKPENIKFADNNTENTEEILKILDFGFSHEITLEETPPCFTLDYAAPESLIKGATKETRDIWSLGVILYTMLIGNTPFKPQTTDREHDDRNFRIQITENIRRGNFNTENSRWNEISNESKDLISSLLRVNERERLTLNEVVNHPWILIEENVYSEDNNDIFINNDDKDIDRIDSDTTVINLSGEEVETESYAEDDKISIKLPSEEIRKSNDDSSSGIVISENNEGSSVSEIEEQSLQNCKKEIDETIEPLIEDELTLKKIDIFAKNQNEQLEPENLSLKPADINKMDEIKIDFENDTINEIAHFEENNRSPFKGFNSLIEADIDNLPLFGFRKEELITKESQMINCYRKLFDVENIRSTVFSNRPGLRPRTKIDQKIEINLEDTKIKTRKTEMSSEIVTDVSLNKKKGHRGRKKQTCVDTQEKIEIKLPFIAESSPKLREKNKSEKNKICKHDNALNSKRKQTSSKNAENLHENKGEIKKRGRPARLKKPDEQSIIKTDESANQPIKSINGRKRKKNSDVEKSPVVTKKPKKQFDKQEDYEETKTPQKKNRGKKKNVREEKNDSIFHTPITSQLVHLQRLADYVPNLVTRNHSAINVKPEPKQKKIIFENVLPTKILSRIVPSRLPRTYIDNKHRSSMIICRTGSCVSIKTESNKSALKITSLAPLRKYAFE